MQKSKQKSKRKFKTRTILLITAAALVGLAVLGIIGKVAFDEISKQQKIEQQRSTLSQTLPDITALYDTFAQTSGYQKVLSHSPVNICNEHSSKGIAKTYTCGSSGELRYIIRAQSDFINILDLLHKAITEQGGFSNLNDQPATELKYTDATAALANMIDKKTGQACSVQAIFYREATEQVADNNTLVISFDCNIVTNELLFNLGDYGA